MKTSIAVCIFAACSLIAADFAHQTVTSGLGYFPVAIRLKNGDVLTVVRGGAPHIGVKGRLDMVRSKDEGKTWSKPWTAIDESQDDRNPALGQLRDGTVVLAYAIASGYDDTGERFKGSRNERIFDGVYLIFSKDNGQTWTKPVRDETIHKFYSSVAGAAVSPYGKIVQLRDGTALMAVYFDFYGDRGHESWVFRSRDNGKTWTEPALIGKRFNETGILALRDGRVLAALRSEKGGHLAIAESTDQGRTWSSPEQVTKDSEHPGDLIQLRDGRVLLSYGERNPPRGARAILSADGRKWDNSKPIVLADDAPVTDCGYPSSVETGPGKIVTLYYQVDDLKNALATSSSRAVLWTAPGK
jgi:Neuraminidase (sialidase)